MSENFHAFDIFNPSLCSDVSLAEGTENNRGPAEDTAGESNNRITVLTSELRNLMICFQCCLSLRSLHCLNE